MSKLGLELKMSISYKYIYLRINRLATYFSLTTTVSVERHILIRQQSKLIGLHWLSLTVSGWRKNQQASEVSNCCASNFFRGRCVAVAGVRSHCRTRVYTLSVQHLWRTSHMSSPKWRPHASLPRHRRSCSARCEGDIFTVCAVSEGCVLPADRWWLPTLLPPTIAIASTTAPHPLPHPHPASLALPPRHG